MSSLLRSPWLSSIAVALATIFGGGPRPQSQALPDGYHFYYLPFAAQTFVPVTPQLLTTQAYDRTASVGRLADDVVSLIEIRTAKPGFDSNMARLAVVFPNKHKAFVDRNGMVLENGKSHQIQAAAWKQLKDAMAKIESDRIAK